jgi:hypothetical protein
MAEQLLSVAAAARDAADDAALRQSVVGGGRATARRSAGTEQKRWQHSGQTVAALVDSAAGDVELAMLERKAALLREELEQLSSGQAAALTATIQEIDRSVTWVEEHLYRDVVASASRQTVRRQGGPAGARVCAVC